MKEEKKNKKTNNQQIYKVRVFKEFEFPSFSIDKYNKLEDLTYKAIAEVNENFKNTENYFDFEIINELPFTLKKPEEVAIAPFQYDYLIKEIALSNTVEKYGELNYDKNPSVFELGDHTEFRVNFYLKPDIEAYYISQVRKYTDVIQNKIVRK